MAIDLARVQRLPKPCGVAGLPPWNRAAEIPQGSEGAFRRLYFRRNRELHIASTIATAHMGAAEVCLKPNRLTDAATFLLSSGRCARTDRIGAGSEFDLEGKRKTSLLVRSGSGQLRKFAAGEARARSESINLQAGRDGMTSLVAYQGVGDKALCPLQRRAQPRATDAAAQRRSPPQTRMTLRGHAGVMQ
jgi:hypothetical protein